MRKTFLDDSVSCAVTVKEDIAKAKAPAERRKVLDRLGEISRGETRP